MSFFSTALPLWFGRIQRLVGSMPVETAPSSAKPPVVTCCETVERLTSFFVCATQVAVADVCGDVLFVLIATAGGEEELALFVLHSCVENKKCCSRPTSLNCDKELLRDTSQRRRLSLLVISLL
ncbi:WD repeat and FYVE domain-containing protein 3-like [Trypanosoma rangeli]|uniref:WD repeat and FYVE domain-containing protein 3-like n=1 Tax=Trypanosoma rangeli TaxID=5698 RepID=A0A3S5IQK5_TRYRA|nr:WD repeat and FYVE domain-containing protein 3-like [Trypanosoma rangeli]RNF00800.1 WD repeat and FYVE domain-containing protein 3-like [Trypanosoma rangeli]|eukprot:RNF00800.1 WD repeat and FYVE domain-containing protein 3-like [Trypanosoma rangeli]